MKKIYHAFSSGHFIASLLLLLLQLPAARAQLAFNELSGDTGNNDGTNDGIVELKNFGSDELDASCYVISNGEWVVVLPPNTFLAPGEVFLIACSAGVGTGSNPSPVIGSGLTCATCDFPGLPIDLDVCDPANAAYIDWAATGFTIDNQNDTDGDQIVLFDPSGNIVQAVKWGGGATGMNDNTAVQTGAYTLGTPGSNGSGLSSAQLPYALTAGSCQTTVTYTMPIITDAVYTDLTNAPNTGGKAINNTVLQGCNSSFIIFGSDWYKTDHPNPGFENDTRFETFYVNGTASMDFSTELCSATEITFAIDVLNYQHVEPLATIPAGSGVASGNVGSFVSTDGGVTRLNWTSVTTLPGGVTRLSYTVTPPTGITVYNLVWDDWHRSTVASTAGGSSSGTAVVNGSTPSDCYTVRNFTVYRPEPLMVSDVDITCPTDFTAGTVNIGSLTTGGLFNRFQLFDNGVPAALPNNTGIFAIPSSLTGPITVEVNNGVFTCNTPITVNIGASCQAAPLCPDPNGETINGGTSPITVCPGDDFTLAVDGATSTNLPDGGTIDWYYNSSPIFNPYDPEVLLPLLGQSDITATTTPVTPKSCGGMNPLAPGDIAIIDVQTSGDDRFSFVPLVPLAAGTVITFTDNGWLSTGGFRSGEGTVTFTVGAGTLAAGTIVTVTNPSLSSVSVNTGTVVRGGSFALATAGDQLTAYCAGSPVVPLAIVHTRRSTFEANATDANTSALPTGLTIGTSAVAIGGTSATIVNGVFNCSGGTISGTPSTIAASVYTAANWTTFATLQTLPTCTYTVSGNSTAMVTPLTASLEDCGQTIYIKGIVQPLPDGCSETNATTSTFTVNVNPCPTVVLSGGGTFCAPTDGTATIQITNGGSGNAISGNITDGTNDFPFSGMTLADGTATITVTGINVSGDFTIETITIDNTCQPTFSGTATITINPAPDVTLTAGTSMVCNGNVVNIPITTSGTLAITVTLNYSPALTGVPTTIEVFTNQISIPIPDDANLTGSIIDYTVTITAVTDANNCTGTFSGSRTLQICPTPTPPTAAPDQTVCVSGPESTVDLTFSVTPQGLDVVEWFDAAVGGTSQGFGNTLTVDDYGSFGPYPETVTFYAESSYSDGVANCVSTTRTPVNVMIYLIPSADVTTTAPICAAPNQGAVRIDLTDFVDGETSDLEYAIVAGATFSGTPAFTDLTADPLDITSGFGTIADADGENYTVRIRQKNSPNCFTDRTYTLTSATDCDCPNPATADAGDDQSVCGETIVNLSATANGSGSWSGGAGTFGDATSLTTTYTPDPSEAGMTVTLTWTTEDPDETGPCSAVSDEVNITFATPVSAGTANDPLTVCENSSDAIDLFSLLTGEEAGGAWTRATGTGGTFNAAAGTFTPAVGASSSTFTYTVTGTSPCSDDAETGTVNIIAQADAGTGSSTTVCNNTTTTITLANLLTGEDTGGAWSVQGGTPGVNFDAAAGTLNPNGLAAGAYIFRYTVTGTTPCPNDFEAVTVNINASPDLAAIPTQTNDCPTETFDLASLTLIDNNNTTGTLSYYNNQTDATNETNPLTSTTISADGTFWIRKETADGCFDVVSVTVDISECVECANPNGETVNGGADPLTVCFDDELLLAVDGATSINLPNGGTIDWYYSDNSAFDPYNGEGTLLGQSTIISGDGSTTIYPLQNFNTLASSGTGTTWTDNVTLSGWYSNRTAYNAGTGSSNAGALYSFGTAAGDRALGSVASGSTGTILYGVQITNTTGATITQLNVQYTGEQWRNGGNTTAHKLDFAYQINATGINTGTWTDVNALDFTGPIATSTASALDGNAAANRTMINADITGLNLLNGQSIWLRWQDVDDSGSDHGLAIDDLTVTTVGASGTTVRSLLTSLPPATCGSTQYIKGIVQPLASEDCQTEGTTATFTVNVNPCPAAVLAAATQPCATSGSATITITNGGNTNSVSGNITNGTTDYPFSGTTLADGTLTISINNITVAGTYTIETIIFGGSLCTPVTSGSAVITLAGTAGEDGSLEVCNNQTALVNLRDVLTGESAGGTWSLQTGSSDPGTAFDAASGTLNANGLAAGTYRFVYSVVNDGECPNDEAVATVVVFQAVQVNAGTDATICSSRPVSLTTIGASISGEATTGTWSASGDGTFTGGTAFGTATAYVPGANDKLSGTVTLTLTSTDPDGPCDAVSDTVVITIQNVQCGDFPWNGQ